jgi:hypothetical protein
LDRWRSVTVKCVPKRGLTGIGPVITGGSVRDLFENTSLTTNIESHRKVFGCVIAILYSGSAFISHYFVSIQVGFRQSGFSHVISFRFLMIILRRLSTILLAQHIIILFEGLDNKYTAKASVTTLTNIDLANSFKLKLDMILVYLTSGKVKSLCCPQYILILKSIGMQRICLN